MRSRLSLRIPGMEELSPSRAAEKHASYSMTLNKRSSPTPSAGKNHHRISTHTSNYKRITSSLSIKNLSLPSFLQITHDNKSEILAKLPLGKCSISQNSECLTDSSSVRASTEDIKNSSLIKPTTAEEFIERIFEKRMNKDEILMRIAEFELSRGDLQSVRPNEEMSRNVFDACLRCIKKINRKFFKSAESHDRVLLVNTEFSQNVFSKEGIKCCQRNPLKYEYVLFPIYVGYWTLVALDNRHKVLKIFNVAEDSGIVEQIFAHVKEFVKRELRFHENKDIDSSGFRELSYEVVQHERVDFVDSAVLTLRIAYKIAINNKATVSSEVLNDFRYNLLVMLFRHGNQA